MAIRRGAAKTLTALLFSQPCRPAESVAFSQHRLAHRHSVKAGFGSRDSGFGGRENKPPACRGMGRRERGTGNRQRPNDTNGGNRERGTGNRMPRRSRERGTGRQRKAGTGHCRFRPNGAMDCSRGWSDAAFGVAQPVGAFVFDTSAPAGRRKRRARASFRQPEKSPSPLRGEKRKRRRWIPFAHPLSTGSASGP